MRLQLTTNPGLEEFLVQELTAAGRERGLGPSRSEYRPHGLKGWVVWEAEGDPEAALDIALASRLAHHVLRPLHTFELAGDAGDLALIRARLAEVEIPELRPEDVSFRVTTDRTGDHPYTSMDVQRAAGAGVLDRTRRPVRMKGYDVDVAVDVRHRLCLVALRHTHRPLSLWMHRPFLPRTALRANLAWAMLHLACPKGAPERLLDPFCGAGTVLLAAGARWPETRLFGSDMLEFKVEGARTNVEAHALTDRTELRLGDARDLERLWEDHRFDAVVTNPPFGRRLGAEVNFDRLYWRLLQGIDALTGDEPAVVLLVEKRGPFKRALAEQAAFKVRHARVVEMGGIHPVLYLLERA